MSCIIVLGCFRSGTSAVAGVLHHLGVFMGEKFDPPNSNNVNGYYEDVELKSLHAKFDDGELDSNPKLMEEYVNLIRKRESEHKVWGLKDPLLCTNLQRFVSVLKTDHKLIVCRRSVSEIALSMSKALKEENLFRYKPLAEFYVRQMNEQISYYKGSILEMDHNETLANPHFHVQKISDFVGLPVTPEALSHVVS